MVDLTKLNAQVRRTVHNSQTAKDAVASVPSGSKYFTVLDAKNGYWQMDLHPDSRDLTTFFTPYGRFRFCRGPIGFILTGDSYNFRGTLPLTGSIEFLK